ncbi:MAG: biotin--[acetyl-CoA-carboxylase] ligase [Dissulfurispiraceae bacterium]
MASPNPIPFGDATRIGKEIIFLKNVTSTNAIAKEYAQDGSPEGTVIVADEQTEGRGRLGRIWLSPPKKNLYMSVILRPSVSISDACVFIPMTSVACATAIKKLTSIDVSIKWPNDLMAHYRKLGGILTEMKAGPAHLDYVIVGIGINVNLAIDELPDEIRKSATSIKIESGKSWSRKRLITAILRELNIWYGIFLQQGIQPVLLAWSRVLSTLGHIVSVHVEDAIFTGIAEGISERGMLLLRLPDKSLKRISSGDVKMLRTLPQAGSPLR